MVAVAKKKRVPKNKKKSWRKHVDITDVENFLEDKRLEERLGKTYDTVPDDQLFQLDTKAASEAPITSKKLKRLQLRNAPLKSCSLLKPLTNVPDPITKRNRVKSKDERKSAIIKSKEKSGLLKKKLLQQVADRRKTKEMKLNEKPVLKYEFDRNIWDVSEADEVDAKIKGNEWITEDSQRHLLHGTGKYPKRLPKHFHEKPSTVNVIEIPHPGTSYNPTKNDYKRLLLKIVEKEKEIIKQEKHLERVTSGMFKRTTEDSRDKKRMKEQAEGLPIGNQNQVKDDPPSDYEYKTVNPPTKNKQKTLQQRRRHREEQKLQEMRRKLRIDKKKLLDIENLKQIKKDVDQIDKKLQKKTAFRLKKIDEHKDDVKRLGRVRYEEPDIDFNAKEDITRHLLMIKKEGNLLRDRYLSLQRRNIIKATKFLTPKTAKIKKFTRAGHKDEDFMNTIARPRKINKITKAN